ncbi:MAG: hypothetical protein IH587_02620 [Anaerolineae bacterium]|nr:hypothetical protein [Anaerolineae bacterium]
MSIIDTVTIIEDELTGDQVIDLGDDVNFHIEHTRTGWIVFTPMNAITRETMEMLAEMGYIRPHGYGYVSTKQTVFEPITEKTRRSRVSR